MTDQKEIIKIGQYIEMVLRYRWYIITSFCLAMIAGIYLAITLPKVYQATTLILVDPQRVPTDYVQSVVDQDINTRISTISQQIMSRSNIEKIINEFNLLTGPEYARMYMEDKIENVRERILVNVTHDRRREADSFSVSFKGKNPQRVMRIANTLATYFIDENLKVREIQAIGTSDFLEGELTAMRNRLEEVEEALKEYRKKYMGELPEQLETNLNILDRLQVQIGEREESLRNDSGRLASIENQLQLERKTNLNEVSGMPESEYILNLRRHKEQLADLKSRYTLRHPDVIRLKKTITDLEEKSQNTGAETSDRIQGATEESQNRGEELYLRQIQEIKLGINSLKNEIVNLTNEIRIYKQRVENTPKREQELMSLRRDYANIQESYSSLLGRKLEAEISVNMERKQKGEQFRVVDSAKLPEKPVSPDMKKLFIFTIAAGLGLGGGFIFLLESMDTSFRRPESIESRLGLSVMATVPKILQPDQKRWRRVNIVMTMIAVIISFCLFCGFFVLTFKGVDQTIAFVQRFVNI